MPTKFLHLDTYYSTYLTPSGNTATSRTNPYTVQFNLTDKIRNVRRVTLKSAEIPISFGQLRGASSNLVNSYMQVAINGTTYSFTMSSRTYTSIDALLTDLNSSWTTYVGTPSGAGGTWSTYTTSDGAANTFRVQLAFPTNTTCVWTDTPFSRCVLGIISQYDSITNNTGMIASGNYNLAPDNFIVMSIAQLPIVAYSANGKPVTFKIPLTDSYGSVNFYSDRNNFEQFVEMPVSQQFILDKLDVTITDRWGLNLNPFYTDYSFSLQVEYDD